MGRGEPVPTDDLSTDSLIETVSREESVPFLGEQRPCDKGKKTLVLDLDETLVHSSFQPTANCQYVIPVTIDGTVYTNSQETHNMRIRQQDPVTKLWSMCEINSFLSAGGARCSIRIQWSEYDVAYAAPTV